MQFILEMHWLSLILVLDVGFYEQITPQSCKFVSLFRILLQNWNRPVRLLYIQFLSTHRPFTWPRLRAYRLIRRLFSTNVCHLFNTVPTFNADMSFTYPGTPPDSIWLAMVTSSDQTSNCHFLSPSTPHSTEPEWTPIRMSTSTHVASRTFLQHTASCTLPNMSASTNDASTHILATHSVIYTVKYVRFNKWRLNTHSCNTRHHIHC